MNQKELFTLSNEKLIWACVEPAMLQARGKDPETKSRVIKQLSEGQRALFLFQVLFGHARNGIAEFFGHISYLTDQLDIWVALKSSMNYFGDTAMAALIDKMERAYTAKVTPLDDLDAQYQKLIPETVARIGERIRSSPKEFLKLEN